MAFVSDVKINELKQKLARDESELKSLYKAKKNKYYEKNVLHNQVEEYIKDGWETSKEQKTKTTIRKLKSHNKKFEDDIWCQFYELGYRVLNRDETFSLPFGIEKEETQQIDVIAADNETVFLIECKSSNVFKKAPSYKDKFELLKSQTDGFRKAIYELFGKDKKIKYIFATRNMRLDSDSEDAQRLIKANILHYSDKIYDYVDSLIEKYKKAARYQFLGLMFKNEKINDQNILLPAIEGKMGGKTYYMFSIEPHLLLKIGFVLHRAKINEEEMPTYQRLLIPNRLKNITKFIDQGGYFPNSLVINFGASKKINFEPAGIRSDSDSYSRAGILKIPNEYSIAYIIDGQHRLYGYADSKFKDTNTIPVVAMFGLDNTKQLDIFMDINENQKAISPSLRSTLEEDLYWYSDRADSRLKALRSSIIRELSENNDSPLKNKITIGEDKAFLTSPPFGDSLSKCGLLPKAKGNQYLPESTIFSLYDVNNHDHNSEMIKTKKKIVKLLIECYSLAGEYFKENLFDSNSLIVTNRGTHPFIMLIGDLVRHLINQGSVSNQSSIDTIFDGIDKYLRCLLEKLVGLSEDEKAKYLGMLGAGVETKWLRFFQSVIHGCFSEYYPEDLVDWQQRQDEALQDEGRKYGEKIESFMKKTILDNLKILFGNEWEFEIGKIARECQNRASLEDEKNYKEGLKKEKTDWTEMFNINDYKEIIEKHWSKKADGNLDFKTFEDIFSIDMDFGFNSKTEKIKWISHFNSYRNLWAHAGTKEKRLNKQEVEFLEKIYKHFYPSAN